MNVQDSGHIHFSWELIYACNYRCPYCWLTGRWVEVAKKNVIHPVNKLMGFWERIRDKYGPACIEILGGEPFLYPVFKNLLRQLSRIHEVGVTTNLSCSIENIICGLNYKKIKIKPTFHPSSANFEDFIEKMSFLKDKLNQDSVFYLAYPPQINLINHYKKEICRFRFYIGSIGILGGI